VLTFFLLIFRSQEALGAENLFLRKQMAFYIERKRKARRASDAIRLTVVKPDTLIRWHRQGFRLFWKWKISIHCRATRASLCSDVDRSSGREQSHSG
jgi:hypothetical protein